MTEFSMNLVTFTSVENQCFHISVKLCSYFAETRMLVIINMMSGQWQRSFQHLSGRLRT
jgi:hypothetical protein